jgi:hypothetical protein
MCFRYYEKVREERKVKEEGLSQDEEEEANTDRERSLQVLLALGLKSLRFNDLDSDVRQNQTLAF